MNQRCIAVANSKSDKDVDSNSGSHYFFTEKTVVIYNLFDKAESKRKCRRGTSRGGEGIFNFFFKLLIHISNVGTHSHDEEDFPET